MITVLLSQKDSHQSQPEGKMHRVSSGKVPYVKLPLFSPVSGIPYPTNTLICDNTDYCQPAHPSFNESRVFIGASLH